MNTFCNINVVGRLTADPVLKTLEDGTKVCNVNLAVDRDYRGKEEEKITDFIPFALWGKNAENICNISKKGSLVYFEGNVTMRESEIDGKKITSPQFKVDNYRNLANSLNQTVEKEEVVEEKKTTKKSKKDEELVK